MEDQSSGLLLEGDEGEMVSLLPVLSSGNSLFTIFSIAKIALSNIVSLISPKSAKFLHVP